MPEPKRYTTSQVAKKCKISDGRVRQIAIDRGVGEKFGRDWSFSEDDLRYFREHRDLRRKNAPEPKPERE